MQVKNYLKALGPGILFASTAIGVSHLVQSTRAGATYGFDLVLLVLLANLFKYPFFEYGSRYANNTGTSIIDGYQKIGNWMLWLYFAITIGSMFFVCSAVGFVTAGFMQNLFGIDSTLTATLIVFTVCTSILLWGKYKILDSLVKVIGSVLLVTTLLAFILTLINGPAPQVNHFIAPEIWDDAGIAFIIALLGWMPTALDLSTWNSLWTVERMKQTGYRPSLKETLFDFNFGYIASAGLAFCFITLGAYLVYGTDVVMPKGSAAFANAVVNLYTNSIGSWSYLIIAAAAFSIMFGTAIAVFDGYARAIKRTTSLLFKREESSKQYNYALIVIAVVSFAIIYYFSDKPKGFRALIDLATTISFLIAPIIAVVNFRLVSKKYVTPEAIPPLWMKVISWAGIVFLSGFSIFYIITKFYA